MTVRERFREALTDVLRGRGLDPGAPDLADTPDRVFRMIQELTSGYAEDPKDVLSRTFSLDRPDQPIIVSGVPFTSACAHHLLPFSGTALIAYWPAPGAPVAGLSKLPRVLDIYARRLQTQEQLTKQVTDALDTHLDTMGSACVIRSEHGCLAYRGARKPGSVMTTASYTGVFRTDADARAELRAMLHDGYPPAA